jgi:DNA-3-methyladenine glycosylase I
MLILEGAQAGLSWITILRKRENYREAFDGFEVAKVARYTPAKIEKLLGNAGIVRNRAKVEAAVRNAKATLNIQDEFGSLDSFVWQFVKGKPIQRKPGDGRLVTTAESDAMSKALLKREMKFVGSTICYSFMQATGMVNDHDPACWRHKPIKALGKGA